MVLWKHLARISEQWDTYLLGLLCSYRNIPHKSTQKKPYFRLLRCDLKTPTEAAFLPPAWLQLADFADCCNEFTVLLASASGLATSCVSKTQHRYKARFDRKGTKDIKFKIGYYLMVTTCASPRKNQARSASYQGCGMDPTEKPRGQLNYVSPHIVHALCRSWSEIHVGSPVKCCPPDLLKEFFWCEDIWSRMSILMGR